MAGLLQRIFLTEFKNGDCACAAFHNEIVASSPPQTLVGVTVYFSTEGNVAPHADVAFAADLTGDEWDDITTLAEAHEGPG